MTTRRHLLATLGVAVGAGCLDRTGSPARTDRPNREPSTERSPTDYTHTGEPRNQEGCTGGFDVNAEPFDPTEELTMRPTDRARSLLADAVESGAAEATLYADTPPVRDGVYVEHDGVYSETAAREVGSAEVPAVVTNLEWKRGQEAPDGADVIAFADLPSADREALRYGVYGGPYERERRGHPKESLSLREVPLAYPGGIDDSVLAGGEETWVRWDDRTYRVWTDGETTKKRHRFRLTVTEVAGDDDSFRSFVADTYLLDLTGLSDAERDILRAAVEEGYEECAPASEDLSALRDSLGEDTRLPPPQHGNWYLAFEGNRYVLTILQWVH